MKNSKILLKAIIKNTPRKAQLVNNLRKLSTYLSTKKNTSKLTKLIDKELSKWD